MLPLLLLFLSCGTRTAIGGTPQWAPEVAAIYGRLARTINMELASEGDGPWGSLVTNAHLDACRAAGFTAVRLPIEPFRECELTPPYRLNPDFLRRVDDLVRRALDRGLAVILDYHKDKPLMKEPSRNIPRFLATWAQLSARYASWPRQLLLELCAEPYDAFNRYWNWAMPAALRIVRRCNADRVVLVGPPGYNSVEGLPYLRLPDDPRLIVVIHVYRPLPFVFQDVSFYPGSERFHGTRWLGTDGDRAPIVRSFDAAADWARSRGRPIFLEEFGCTDSADLESRVRWTAFNRREAEKRGWAWGIWGFGPSFAIYDLSRGQWKEPLLGALIPWAVDHTPSPPPAPASSSVRPAPAAPRSP